MSDNPTCRLCDNNLRFLYDLPNKEHGSFSILECNNCEFITAFPLPKDDEIKDLYTESPSVHNVAPEVSGSKILTLLKKVLIVSPALRKLRGFCNASNPSLLDIGCSSGWITSMARSIGFKTTGLELNPSSAEYGREKYGLKIIESSIEDFDTEHSFNAVIMFHVLEHIPDPVSTLIKIKSLTSDYGVILIVVPNAKSLGASMFAEHHNWNPPQHVSFFSPKSISILLKNTGFEIITINHLPSPPILLYSFNNSSKHTITSPLLGNLLFTPVSLFGTAINKGEVIAVYARKLC